MNKILEIIFAFINQHFFSWIKIESLKLYMHISELSRTIFKHTAVIFLLFLIALSGFIFIHGALFFLISWSTETKAIILLILGSIYFFVPLFLALMMASKKQWSRISGLKDFSRKISK